MKNNDNNKEEFGSLKALLSIIYFRCICSNQHINYVCALNIKEGFFFPFEKIIEIQIKKREKILYIKKVKVYSFPYSIFVSLINVKYLKINIFI